MLGRRQQTASKGAKTSSICLCAFQQCKTCCKPSRNAINRVIHYQKVVVLSPKESHGQMAVSSEEVLANTTQQPAERAQGDPCLALCFLQASVFSSRFCYHVQLTNSCHTFLPCSKPCCVFWCAHQLVKDILQQLWILLQYLVCMQFPQTTLITWDCCMRHATPWIVVDNWFNKVCMPQSQTMLTDQSL